jgi:hypothetical protein
MAFALLGLMVILGTVLVVFGAQKLRQQLHVGNRAKWSGTMVVSLDILALVLGLFLAGYGMLGTYRIIYGS